MNTALRPARRFLPVIVFLASGPFLGASTWWIHSQLSNRQSTDGSESTTSESHQSCDTGQTYDYRDSFERHADGSNATHEVDSGNGTIDSTGWHDDGGSWSHTRDITIDSDGSCVEHDVYTKTDKNGNSETWENVSTYDSKGRKTSDNSLHDYKPRGKPPRKE